MGFKPVLTANGLYHKDLRSQSLWYCFQPSTSIPTGRDFSAVPSLLAVDFRIRWPRLVAFTVLTLTPAALARAQINRRHLLAHAPRPGPAVPPAPRSRVAAPAREAGPGSAKGSPPAVAALSKSPARTLSILPNGH